MTEQEAREKIERFNTEIRAAAEAIAPEIAILSKALVETSISFGRMAKEIIQPFIDIAVFVNSLHPAIKRELAKERHLLRYERMYARGPKPSRVHKKVRR